MSPSGPQPPAQASRGVARALSGPRLSLAEVLGGPRGVVENVLPGLVFVVVFTAVRRIDWAAALSLGTVAVFVLARLVRRETLQYALGGLVGVLIGAFVAQRSGRAEDFFLPSLWKNAGWAVVYLVSIVVRWPLLGVTLGFVTGEGTSWRRDPARMRAYTLASWVWFAMFALRLAVQLPLYAAGAVTALGVANVLLGLPLFALVVLASWRILRAVPPTVPATLPPTVPPMAPGLVDGEGSRTST